MRAAIDIGGTFTDIILYEDENGIFTTAKVPSHPENPEIPFIEGLLKVLKLTGKDLSQVNELVHGTTVVTNALLEGKTAKVGLLVTQGFKDILEIGRQQRPSLYDLTKDRITPLVPRDCVTEIKERISPGGKILAQLNKEDAVKKISDLKKKNIEALAIALLFSFSNPKNERLLEKLARKEINTSLIYLSSQVSPEFREYERTCTTVIAAAVAPMVLSYIQAIQKRLKDKTSESTRLEIMHSGGGTLSADEAGKRPHALIESGPAAGLIGADQLSKVLNLDRVIAFDMGGTTAKAGMILNGELQFSTEYEVGGELHHSGGQRGSGYPVRTPMINVVECGAGAGSIAWIDKGGHLKVGPQSAGADPGPACYGKGGNNPTVTDAHLVLGRLSAQNFLGGEMPLYPELSEKAIKQNISLHFKMTLEEAALGILAIANASMLRILRLISVRRGYDPRAFTLIAYGGAGPLHATDLAEKMLITHIIIPRMPGLFSTLGLLYADMNTDFVETVMTVLKKPGILNKIIGRLKKKAKIWFEKNNVAPQKQMIQVSTDLRYVHQNYEINIPLQANSLSENDILSFRKKFHEAHATAYGLSSPSEDIQIVNMRLRATKLHLKPEMPDLDSKACRPKSRKSETRPVWIKASKIDCRIYERSEIYIGERIKGPAVIQEKESTTLIGMGWHMQVDKAGNLHIKK